VGLLFVRRWRPPSGPAGPWLLRATGCRPLWILPSIWPVRIPLPQLSPKCVDRIRDGRGALQCCFLEYASSSLFILFGPQAVASQERFRFFYPFDQIHVDDRIGAKILGEGSRSSSTLADNQGRAPWLTM